MNTMYHNWHLELFKKSILKQNKWRQIDNYIGDTDGLGCLDIGSDNGVISYLLRQNGGIWSSADLADVAVESIRSLVSTNVYQINGGKTHFKDNEFDKIVIVDFLEHIPNDGDFLNDMYRILKPGGELIVNVPHLNNSLLRWFRYAIGQTDEKHGHLRPGYSLSQIEKLLGDKFIVISHRTYSCFFSEAIDTFITLGYGFAKRNSGNTTSLEKSKGVLVTSSDMSNYKKTFWLYSLIYPILWVFGKLDKFLFLSKGYMLIVKTKSTKLVTVDEKRY